MLPLLIGAAALIGGILILANWDDVVDWLKEFVRDLKASLRTWMTKYGGSVFMQLLGKLVAIIHKFFYQDEQKNWYEKTTTRKVDETEVPDYILRKAKNQNQEYDITPEMEKETQMTLTM